MRAVPSTTSLATNSLPTAPSPSTIGRIAGRLVGVCVLALVAAGCGEIAENLVEEGVEQAIEHDSGEDIELDFDGEDGLRIETDEGTMSIDGDGSLVIEGADGEVVTGEVTDDGYTITDGDGTEVLDIDEQDGVVTAETEDGSFTAGPGLPDGWPDALPGLTGLDELNGSTIAGDDMVMVTATGTTAASASAYFADYESSLESSGYERTSYFEGDGFRQGTYSGANYTVNLVADEGTSMIAVTVQTAEG